MFSDPIKTQAFEELRVNAYDGFITLLSVTRKLVDEVEEKVISPDEYA